MRMTISPVLKRYYQMIEYKLNKRLKAYGSLYKVTIKSEPDEHTAMCLLFYTTSNTPKHIIKCYEYYQDYQILKQCTKNLIKDGII